MTFRERTDCRLCGGGLERVLDLGATPLANALLSEETARYYEAVAAYQTQTDARPEFTAPLYLSRCLTCGHVQLPIVVDPKLLFPEDYPYCSATGASFRKHLDELARHVFLMRGGGLVVEIGSNDGYLLERFRSHGFRVLGIDPAAKLAAQATDRGCLTLPWFFNTYNAWAARYAAGQADVVIANNVFAHCDDLTEFVNGVRILLKPDGMFIFEVGYLPDVVAYNNFPVIYHEHVSYHTLAPLRVFLARHGLQLYSADCIGTQGGSIRCYATPGDVVPNKRLAVQLSAEETLSFDGWQARVNAAAGLLAAHLRGLKDDGKTIAGYGCSAKSTTLLHVAGIGKETIDFICDDAQTKQGKFSPGKHIPVVPGSWLEEKQPDFCVSLSGNFSDAFKASHPDYRGQWIEPELNHA